MVPLSPFAPRAPLLVEGCVLTHWTTVPRAARLASSFSTGVRPWSANEKRWWLYVCCQAASGASASARVANVCRLQNSSSSTRWPTHTRNTNE